jgi:membrane protein required for colicin V production
MNYLDVIIIVLLGLSVLHGLRKGLIVELATLAALFAGLFAGYYFSDFVAGLLGNAFDYQGKYIEIISFAIVFLTVVVLVHLLARIIERAVKAVSLGFLNKLLGAVFSLLKAVFILSILIYFLNRFDENAGVIKPETRQASVLFPIVEKIAPAVIPKMQEKFIEFREKEQRGDLPAQDSPQL